MTIDKKQLISLLAEKTGSERAHIESQLSELINRIQKAADEGKSFEIEGFGTFTLKDGGLQFDPTDVLETEINNKYAGMKPIELIGAFKQTDAGDDEITFDEIPPIDEEKMEAEIEKRSWAFDETSVDDQERIEKAVFGRNFNEGAGEADEKELKKDKIIEAPEITEPVVNEPIREKVKTEAVSEPESDPIGKVLTVAAVVLIIGIAGWLIYDMGIFSLHTIQEQPALQEPVERSEATIAATQQVNIAETSIQTGTEASSEPEEPEEVTNVRDETSQPEQNPYGLQGKINNAINTGYTIVVHSFRRPAIADEVKNSLQAQGFRVMVMNAVVNGSNYYRVGLGQFKSVDAAQQAVTQLPDKFKNNNFIKRF